VNSPKFTFRLRCERTSGMQGGYVIVYKHVSFLPFMPIANSWIVQQRLEDVTSFLGTVFNLDGRRFESCLLLWPSLMVPKTWFGGRRVESDQRHVLDSRGVERWCTYGPR
jgi:hypothetical protein